MNFEQRVNEIRERLQAGEMVGKGEFVIAACQGNIHAANFLMDLGEVLEAWDNLVDGDKDMDAEAISKGFWAALVSLPLNGFFAANCGYLVPVMAGAFNAWEDSNELARSNDLEDLGRAHVMRDNVVEIVCQVAYLVGGRGWMRKISPVARRIMGARENLEEFIEDLAKE